MIITTTTWPGTSVVQPTIERPTAMRLAQTEYQRITDAVAHSNPRTGPDPPTARRGMYAGWSPTSSA
jgi:hypothetical protein